jgi:molecular chaperone GrpE
MTSRINQNPSELEGSTTEAKPQGDQPVEAVASPADPRAQLQADLAEARAEAAEWQDRFLRKAAEFENFRKRTDKEKAESMMLAKSSILVEFLPIADACERALTSIGEGQKAQGGIDQYREGVELLYRQMLDTLARSGVVPMEAKGRKFDPHLHEALSLEATSIFEENTVIEELRRGYLFKGRLLRPSQVIVATAPRDDGKTPS